jgi:hypothetical protein
MHHVDDRLLATIIVVVESLKVDEDCRSRVDVDPFSAEELRLL